MDKSRLLALLSTYNSSALLSLLGTAYDEMSFDQREAVFGSLVSEALPVEVGGPELLDQVKAFRRESLARKYFAPFAIDSKNFQFIPSKTKEWFGRLGALLQASSRLTTEGDYWNAAACFGALYELIDAMERGVDIVFADEYGGWMIPGDERQFIAAYMTALAATTTPTEFTKKALPLIVRDGHQSFTTEAYAAAIRSADELQRMHLTAEIQRQKIKTERSTPNEA